MPEHLTALNEASGLERPAELEAKHALLRQWLERSGLDGVLLQRHENLAWISAGQMEARVRLASETGVLTLLLLRDGRRFALAPNNEADRLAAEELAGLGYAPVVRPWHALDVAEEARRIAGDRLAADSLPGFPAAELASLRAPLFPAEIARYRVLGSEVARIVSDALLALTPGISEYDMEAGVAAPLLAAGIAPSVLLMAADERISRYKHAVARGQRLRRFGMLNLCARRWGLVVSITRFIHFGPLPEELARGFRTAQAVNAALQHATHNSATADTLFQTAAAAYAAAGMPGEEQLHHQGGACGYMEREWVARPGGTETVREAGAFAWNPSARGGKAEDTVLAVDGQIDLLTRTPELPEVVTEVEGKAYISAGVLLRP